MEFRGFRPFAEHRSQPAPGAVPHAPQPFEVKKGAQGRPQGCAVAQQSFHGKVEPGGRDGCSVPSHGRGDEKSVTLPYGAHGERPGRPDLPEGAARDDHSVHRPRGNHLCVPGGEGHAEFGAGRGGALHVGGDLFRRNSLLEDEAYAEEIRARSPDGQIVCAAADAQVTDVAAGKSPGRDGKAVHRHGVASRKEGRVLHLGADAPLPEGFEEVRYEIGALPPAASVSQGDCCVLHDLSPL